MIEKTYPSGLMKRFKLFSLELPPLHCLDDKQINIVKLWNRISTDLKGETALRKRRRPFL